MRSGLIAFSRCCYHFIVAGGASFVRKVFLRQSFFTSLTIETFFKSLYEWFVRNLLLGRGVAPVVREG